MNAGDLLASLEKVGATVHVVGSRLRVEGPRGVVTPGLRAALAERKREILRLLRSEPVEGQPSRGAPDPGPPELWEGGRLAMDEETAQVFGRFAEHGTQPAWDDLLAAAHLERQRAWCVETLDAVYRGRVTLAFLQDGRLASFQRGLVS